MSTQTMSATLQPSARQSQQAGEVAAILDAHRGQETVALQVPQEMAQLLAQLLPHVASGASISFTATPEELTTTTAAAMLGMSRPTLMKLIRAGELSSHKVGTHTRLLLSDVKAYRKAMLAQRREAYRELLAMDEEAGISV